MRKCGFNERVIDYIEGALGVDDSLTFEEHLKTCELCQREVNEIKKVYEIMDKDVVPEVEKEFFERLKVQVRQMEIVHKRPYWRIFRILVPIFAVLALIVVPKLRHENRVEISISVSNLVETGELNYLLLDRVIDEEILSQFEILEEDFTSNIESGLEELSVDEKKNLIESIRKRYGEI